MLFSRKLIEEKLPEKSVKNLKHLIEKQAKELKFKITNIGEEYITEQVEEFKELYPHEYSEFTSIATPIIEKLLSPNYCNFCDRVVRKILVYNEFKICKKCCKKEGIKNEKRTN